VMTMIKDMKSFESDKIDTVLSSGNYDELIKMINTERKNLYKLKSNFMSQVMEKAISSDENIQFSKED